MAEHSRPRSIDRSSPAWLITYGDMATLLLVFFVFLFSVSKVKEEKFRAATGALRASVGARPRKGSVVESRQPVEVRRRERREKNRFGLPGKTALVLAAAQGPRVVFGGRITFGRGSADIEEDQKKTLRELADEIRGLPNIVEVRGHAEVGEGAGGRADDDMDLSLARAAKVLGFLVKDGEVTRARLRAMGAGSEEPADARLYADQPARDRRVEIVVVREIAAESGGRELERLPEAAGGGVPQRRSNRAEEELPPAPGPLDPESAGSP